MTVEPPEEPRAPANDERTVLCVSADEGLADRLAALAPEGVAVRRGSVGPEAAATVIDGADLSREALEHAVAAARAASDRPILAVLGPDSAPLYRRRATVAAAGADDSVSAEAPDAELAARLCAMLVERSAGRVLVVEDEAKVADWVAGHLARDGCAVRVAGDLRAARAAFEEGPIDAMLLDRRLPDGDGLDFLRELRGRAIATPALMFTAWNEPVRRVEGLQGGADDYIGKPIHPDELRARVALLLRPRDREARLGFGALEIARADEAVRWQGRRLDLRPREYALLAYLAAREGLRIPQKMLLQDVWDRAFAPPDANPVTQAKSRLTKALRAAGVPDEVIVTEADCYRFDPGPLLRLGRRGSLG